MMVVMAMEAVRSWTLHGVKLCYGNNPSQQLTIDIWFLPTTYRRPWVRCWGSSSCLLFVDLRLREWL